MFAHGQTITRLRATAGSDAYGTTLDWTSPAELSIDGCGVAPLTEGELNGAGRAGAVVGFTMYAPHDADIARLDRVRTADGQLFEVDGAPGAWANPFSGHEHGMTVSLRRVEG